MKPLNVIPEHTNCRNCGACCGPRPLNDSEQAAIDAFLATSKYARQVARTAKSDPLCCKYRDERQRKCAVYPVRPLVCRLMGVSRGMRCPYGNSAYIDAAPYLQGYGPGPITNVREAPPWLQNIFL